MLSYKKSKSFLYGVCLTPLLLTFTPSIYAQTDTNMQTIISQIAELEDRRDPKCYATATRLENFMYGTPLDDEARFAKNKLQKAWALKVWETASQLAHDKQLDEITVDEIVAAQKSIFTYKKNQEDKWVLAFANSESSLVEDRDKKHYGSVAYALRAIIAVQQESMMDIDSELLPLSTTAVQSLKEALDLYTLAVLQEADRQARATNLYSINRDAIILAWSSFMQIEEPQALAVKKTKNLEKKLNDLKILKSLIVQKLASYKAYNAINNQLFVRNLQVYFARMSWPKDKDEGKLFRNTFTETMISFSDQLYRGSQQLALSRGHNAIEEKDVFDFIQTFIPHSINEYEDALFFPNFSKDKQVIIESYDMDAFRDSGLHWTYLKYVVQAPNFQAYLEPDPFATELIVENIAQFGVLVLRLTGEYGKQQGDKRLKTEHFTTALKQLQTKIGEHSKEKSQKKSTVTTLSSAKSHTKVLSGDKYFSDVTKNMGIESMHRSSDWLNRQLRTYLKKNSTRGTITIPPAFGGAGVAAEDFNNDGFIDILILSGLGNKLYKNINGKKFEDVTQKAGLVWVREEDKHPGEPRQPLIADLDNDGFKDIIITYANDQHRVYKNRGDETFEDLTAKANLGGKGMITGPAALIDIDNDGLLDIYVSYFGDYIRGVLPTLKRRNDNGRANQLFRNKGGFVFENISKGSGVEDSGWAQALTHTDFDSDGKQDIILGNDFGINSYFQNQGDGTFIDIAAQLGTDKPSYTMNLSLSDLNGDFIPDIYVSNIVTMNKDEKYVLPASDTQMKFNPEKLANMRVVEANDLFISQKNDENKTEYHLSNLVGRGYSSTGWSWDADFFDYDNDGDDDLYVVNGMNEFNLYSSENPYYADPDGLEKANIHIPVSPKEKNVFFVNEAGLLQNHSQESGMNILTNSRSASYFDYDNDGDQDVIINNYHQASFLFENAAEKLNNNWLKVELIGDPKAGVNRDAIGTQLRFTTASKRHIWRQVSSVTGYMSVHPKEQHIGLGDERKVDLTIIWSNGHREEHKDISSNQRIQIQYGKKDIKVK